MAERSEWVVAGSKESHATINPINTFMEVHFTEAIENCKKELFRLGAGELASYLVAIRKLASAIDLLLLAP